MDLTTDPQTRARNSIAHWMGVKALEAQYAILSATAA
jgi:hypothetical protein